MNAPTTTTTTSATPKNAAQRRLMRTMARDARAPQTDTMDMGSPERARHHGGIVRGARVHTGAGIVVHEGAAASIECVLDALRRTGLLNGSEGTPEDRTAVGRSRYDQGLWLRGLFLRAGLNGVQAMDISRKTGTPIGPSGEISDDAARARMKYNRVIRELGPNAEAVTSFVCFDVIKRGGAMLTLLRQGLDKLCAMRG
jgi:hypothetical protein